MNSLRNKTIIEAYKCIYEKTNPDGLDTEMFEYKLSEKLHNLLEKEGINVSFNKYENKDTICVALVQIKYPYFDYEFKCHCGKPKTIDEIEDALASGVRDYIGDKDGFYRYYDIADTHFREHLEEIHIYEALDFAKEIMNKLKTMLKILTKYQIKG